MRHHAAAVLVMAVLMLTAGCGDDPAEVDTGTPVDRGAVTETHDLNDDC